jgi:hypothetical protein
MGRAGAGGHAKDARWRQMRHQGVDERGDAAVTAAAGDLQCATMLRVDSCGENGTRATK